MTPQTLQKWHRDKIGNLGRVVTGKTPPTAHKEFYVGEFPFITPSDISTFDVRYISDTERTISSFWASKNKKYILPRDAITYVCIGSTVGKIGLTEKESITNQQINALVANPLKLVPQYGYYLLRNITPEIQQIASARGAGKGIMNKSQFEDFDVIVPSVDDQQSIADILSRYDDLIENNTLQIQILEQIAQAIYTEWFIHFRFPGHEKIKMIDSDTVFGKIPEGWAISNIGSILDIKSGYTFKSKSYTPVGSFKIVTIKNIHDGKFIDDFNYIPEIPKNMPDHCRLSDGDILLSLTGNVGRVCIIYGENLLLNQRVGKIVPKNILFKSYIYSLFRSDNFKRQLELLSNGVAQQNLSPVQTLDLKVVLPPPKLINEFDNLISEFVNMVVNLNKQNQSLSKSRDSLLPKLVTGELKI